MTHVKRFPTYWLASLALAVVWVLQSPTPSAAQDTKLKLYYSYEPDVDLKELAAVDIISVRPNVKVPLYLYLENSLKDDFDCTVELSRVTKKGPVAFSSTTIKLPKKGDDDKTVKQLVSGWTPPGGPPKPVNPGVAPPPPPPAPELEMPFKIELKATLKGKEPQVFILNVSFMQPREYIDATALAFDDKKKEFAVEIKRRKELSVPLVPPCEVSLELDNSPHPLLVRPIPKTNARLVGQLTPKIDSVTLRAGALVFRNPEKDQKISGPVFVTVDGWNRAFGWTTEFAGTPTLFKDKTVRVAVDRYVKAADFLTVRAETDNIDDWLGTTLKVAMDADGDGKFTDGETQTFPTTRQLRVLMLPPGEDGSVQFQTVVKDWDVTFPTKAMYGDVVFGAWLLDKNGKILQDGETLLTEKRLVTIDGTPPEKVAFVDVFKTAPSGKALLLAATAIDPESGIKEAWFGVAPVTGDAKWKKDAVPGTRAKDAKRKDVWLADLELGDFKGTIEVGVLFVNNAGMTESTTLKISVVDPKLGGPSGKKLATIYALVHEGELEQNGLEVVLLDKDGKEVKREKTDTQKDVKGKPQRGLAIFKDLEPGKYTVATAKSASRTVGQATVDVKEGESKPVDVKLYRP